MLDHAAIYFLIAGTYTPVTLGPLRGPWGFALFGTVWGLAIAGVIFKVFYTGRFPRLSAALYLASGWLMVVGAGPLLARVGVVPLTWLMVGGVIYIAGTACYAGRRPWLHPVWHSSCLAGAPATVWRSR